MVGLGQSIFGITMRGSQSGTSMCVLSVHEQSVRERLETQNAESRFGKYDPQCVKMWI
jgi:hypothetical protein